MGFNQGNGTPCVINRCYCVGTCTNMFQIGSWNPGWYTVLTEVHSCFMVGIGGGVNVATMANNYARTTTNLNATYVSDTTALYLKTHLVYTAESVWDFDTIWKENVGTYPTLR